jgi:hypothetical protein
MFDNLIIVKDRTASTYHESVTAVDWSKPGRSVRENGGGASLVISGLISKENPGYDTRRTVVRWEVPNEGGSVLLSPNAKSVVQVVFSDPLDANWSVEYGMARPLAGLINFLYSGGNAGALLVQADNATLLANLSRLREREI